MDAALTNKTRKFPAYSLAELESWLPGLTGEKLAMVEAEIAARKSGASKPLVVPAYHGPLVVKMI